MLELGKCLRGRRLFKLAPIVVCLIFAASEAGSEERAAVLTGKEKLAGKATDEQRVDNCKVPLKKRGAKSRPGKCGAKEAGAKTK